MDVNDPPKMDPTPYDMHVGYDYASDNPNTSPFAQRSPNRRYLMNSYGRRSRSRSRSRNHERPRSPSPRSYYRRDSYGNRLSRSRSLSPSGRGRHGRSVSRLTSPLRGGRHRYDSRSPPRRRHRSRDQEGDRPRKTKELHGTRDAPEVSNILGVFGLSLRTTERDVEAVFGEYGELNKVIIIYDRRTGSSRGFAFVYFDRVEDAMRAREVTNGLEIDGRRIRVDFSVTHRPHTPTPGEYMGERRYEAERGRRTYAHRHRSRTPSPYRGRRVYRTRNRSRSYSR